MYDNISSTDDENSSTSGDSSYSENVCHSPEPFSSNDENSQAIGFSSDSDEDCQILEEKLVSRPTAQNRCPTPPESSQSKKLILITIKRLAEEPALDPRELNGFKRPALQGYQLGNVSEGSTGESSNQPSTSSQNLVQPPIQNLLSIPRPPNPPPSHNGSATHQSYPMPQIQSCMSLSITGHRCAGSSTKNRFPFLYPPCISCNRPVRPIPMRPPEPSTSHYPTRSPVQEQDVEQYPVNNHLNESPTHHILDNPPLQHNGISPPLYSSPLNRFDDSPRLPRNHDDPPLNHYDDNPRQPQNHDDPPLNHYADSPRQPQNHDDPPLNHYHDRQQLPQNHDDPPLNHYDNSPQLPQNHDNPLLNHYRNSPQLLQNHDDPPLNPHHDNSLLNRHNSPNIPSQSNSMTQTIQTCMPIQLMVTNRVPSSLLPVPSFAASSLPPGTEAFQQLQAANEASTSRDNENGGAIHEFQNLLNATTAALDLSNPAPSSPLQVQVIGNPVIPKESRTIWRGNLYYQEKAVNSPEPYVSHYLNCSFSVVVPLREKPEVIANQWPHEMSLGLMPSSILKQKNMFNVLKHQASHVFIQFNEEENVIKRIKRSMSHGWMGVVQFTLGSDVRIIIILYMPQKKLYVGFLAHDQRSFFNTFRHVYEKKRRLRKAQQAGLHLSSNQPTSSSVSNPIVLNEANANRFGDIDKEIDAHISALHRRNQQSQPSTSQANEPGPSHSAHDQSIEERLDRLEAAQSTTATNNAFEDIDNEINAHIAAHWLKHFSQEAAAPRQPPARVSFATNIQEGVNNVETQNFTNYWQAPLLTPPTFRPYFPLVSVFNGLPQPGTQNFAPSSQIVLSTSFPPRPWEENPVEAQACEIFPTELVQKVVQMKVKKTGSRYSVLEELCDDILRYEESRPVEKSKSEVSEELLCKVCLDQRMNTVFEPCGHLSTCQDCSRSLTKCPMCRTFVTKKMKIYMS